MQRMIVVAGEALIDQIVQPDGSAIEVPGGSPFNMARTIARLGVAAAFLGCLSTDRLGVRLRRALAEDGVDLSFCTTTDAPTTVALAEVDAHGIASYRFRTAGTSGPALGEAAVQSALQIRPAALALGSLGLVLEPMAGALADGVARCPPETLVAIDPNCRPSAISDRAAYVGRLRGVLGRADLVKVSTDDLAYLWPGLPAGAAAQQILELGSRVVLVTDGPGPVACHAPGFDFELGVPAVAVIDTVGAGDAFGGAFLARWIACGFGRDELSDEAALREVVLLAIQAAGLTCRRPGADPPRRDEVAWPAG